MAKGKKLPEGTDSGGERTPQQIETDTLVQILGVYQIDLLAEVEGLLRSLTKMQQQVERLRPNPDPSGTPNISQREPLKLLTGNLKTLVAKLDTIKDTVPEIQGVLAKLEAALVDESPATDKLNDT